MEKLPAQMTVVGISKPGGPEVLVPETRALPVPGPGEILVKVKAAGVNRPDVAQRSGDVYDLKKLFAASLDARFLAAACCRRSISEFIKAMRSVNSSTDSSDRSWPIS